jgi:LacI family transcriptional regulator
LNEEIFWQDLVCTGGFVMSKAFYFSQDCNLLQCGTEKMELIQPTKPKQKRATIYEVARLAKVSHVTVNRAFREEGVVSNETRKKVLAAAKELQYRPNPLAKGLNGARTQTLAVVWPMGYTFVCEQAVAELVTKSQGRNYQIQLANTLNDLQMVKRLLDELLHRAVDAVILNITPETFDREVEALLKQFRAAVVVTVSPLELAVDQIVWDRTVAIRAAIDHLVGIGRKKLGYLCFNIKKLASGQVMRQEQYKADAFIGRLREHGIQDPEKGIIDNEELIDWDDFVGLQKFIEKHSFSGRFPFDAVLCMNDEWAMLLVALLRRHGLRVPEDVAVVGYNDSRAALLYEPPLASVNRRDQKVVAAIEKLAFARLEHSELPPQTAQVPMEFIWRESAGK